MLLELNNISKTYKMPGEDVHALRGVSFGVERGSFVSIVGSSGSGKTTLLYLLGLLTDPNGGTYAFNGRDVSSLSDAALAAIRGSEIGFVFQSFHLVPQLSVVQNVLLASRYARLDDDPQKVEARAGDLLQRVGLGHRLGHRPRELSGGEMQRVAIARALLTEPQLILADEPTGNLDEQNGAEVFRLLEELCEEGHTIVLVTHDLDLAQRTPRQIRLKDGALIQDVQQAAV